MKNKILIIILVVAIFITGVVWFDLSDRQLPSDTTNGSATTTVATTQNQFDSTSSIETVTISSEKPASLEGVEMRTYRNQFGYEITYPDSWTVTDITDSYYKQDVLSVFEIKPQESSERHLQDQILTIAVEKTTLNDLMAEIKSGKNIYIQNVEELSLVSINGVKGLQRPFKDQEAFYYFEMNNKVYSLRLRYDSVLNISKEEALWVLSTFEIVE